MFERWLEEFESEETRGSIMEEIQGSREKSITCLPDFLKHLQKMSGKAKTRAIPILLMISLPPHDLMWDYLDKIEALLDSEDQELRNAASIILRKMALGGKRKKLSYLSQEMERIREKLWEMVKKGQENKENVFWAETIHQESRLPHEKSKKESFFPEINTLPKKKDLPAQPDKKAFQEILQSDLEEIYDLDDIYGLEEDTPEKEDSISEELLILETLENAPQKEKTEEIPYPEEQNLQARASHYGLEILNPSNYDNIPREVLDRCPMGIAWQYEILPIKIIPNGLFFAIHSPEKSLQLQDDLRFIFGCEIELGIIERIKLIKLLERYYPETIILPSIEEDLTDETAEVLLVEEDTGAYLEEDFEVVEKPEEPKQLAPKKKPKTVLPEDKKAAPKKPFDLSLKKKSDIKDRIQKLEPELRKAPHPKPTIQPPPAPSAPLPPPAPSAEPPVPPPPPCAPRGGIAPARPSSATLAPGTGATKIPDMPGRAMKRLRREDSTPEKERGITLGGEIQRIPEGFAQEIEAPEIALPQEIEEQKQEIPCEKEEKAGKIQEEFIKVEESKRGKKIQEEKRLATSELAPKPKKIHTFEKFLGDEAGKPGIIERGIAQSVILMKAFDRIMGLKFLWLANSLDITISMVTGYIQNIFQAWKMTKAIQKRIHQTKTEVQIQSLSKDWVTIRIQVSRLFSFSGFYLEECQAALNLPEESQKLLLPTFPLKLVIETRGNLDDMKRDLSLLTRKQIFALMQKSFGSFFVSFIPNPVDIFMPWKDFFILIFWMNYSREDIEEMYTDFLLHYQRIFILLQEKPTNNPEKQQDSVLFPLCEYENSLLKKLKKYPEDLTLEQSIEAASKSLQRLLQMLLSPGTFLDPKKWTRHDLLQETATMQETQKPNPLFMLELETWLRKSLDQSLSKKGIQIDEKESRLRKEEEKDLRRRCLLEKRLRYLLL